MKQYGKAVNSLQGAEQYGVSALTGEACNMGTRLLCDYSATGRDNLCMYLGMHSLDASSNMNGYVGEEEAIGGIFMTPAMLWEFIAFCVFFEGYDVVVPSQPDHYGVYGFNLNTAAAKKYYGVLQREGLNLLRNRNKIAVTTVSNAA